MSQKIQTAITPTREQDYPEWYQQVIKASDLAEASPVRGCMVIKPWGYAIWENMQAVLDKMFKDTGHENAYFPLLIPMSFLQQEAEHVTGFAKECAVVTHHRLEEGADGRLKPAGELEEPYIIRPTSETIIGHSYAKWVQSYRDLPILINQWANVMRWEMRTRMFLRTSEFLWQEGHTVHATAQEAQEETLKMLDVYERFCHEFMAVPVIKGIKTPEERFPGAVETYSIEAMMQDRKALQAGTSHFLGQKFAKASGIKFLNQQGIEEFAWTTSWGVSTRLIGALIMSHSDDDGLVLPPRLAPKHIVINPIWRDDSESSQVIEYCQRFKKELEALNYHGSQLRVLLDLRDIRGGEKNWFHIKRGVPLRIEVGPRDIASDSVMLARRHLPHREKLNLPRQELLGKVLGFLDEMQSSLFQKALQLQKESTQKIASFSDLVEYFTPKNEEKPELHGGFALAQIAIGDTEVLEKFKKLKVSCRNMPLNIPEQSGVCIVTGRPTNKTVILAKSY